MIAGTAGWNAGRRRHDLLENYFGLIEAAFVFGLAIAFYVWQKRDLRKYDRQDAKPPDERAADRDEP
jgi:hypothetical protein